MLEMKIFFFCFCTLIFIGKQGQSFSYCQESRCGAAGPPIRFPFRLKYRQHEHCGYGGFDLSCTETNDTLLELPNSVFLYVKTIDYVNQVINVSHPDNCIQRQARNLSFSGSPFQFNELNLYNFALLNCSKSADQSYIRYGDYDFVPCLGVPGYYVYAYVQSEWNHFSDSSNLISCTKMYNVFALPLDMFSSRQTYDLQLTWSDPACGNCEAQGGRCELKSTGSSKGQITCFKISQTTRGVSIKLIITVVASFLVVLLFAAVFLLHRSDRKEKENQARIEKFLEDYEALTPTRYSYADLKRITNQFEDTLGQGAYGTVFKGKLSNEILVAVKMLNNSTGNGEEFINEVATMGSIHHVNVVRLVGFCAEGFRRALVYEFLPNESLEKFIFSNDHGGNNNRNVLGWKKLQDIALGIAKGIEYLHQGCDQRILHFDIKPHNILLDGNFTPKISDFGMAKLCSKDQSVISMTTARGTMGYIAPEVFSRNFGNVSYKSDIYSFGVLLLEMVGGRKNRNSTNNAEETKNQVFFPEWIYDHLDRREELRVRIVEEGDAAIARKLTTVGLWCIQWSPVDRPSMTTVVQMLEGEGNDLAIPPNPFASTGLREMEAQMPAARRIHQELAVISEIE